MTKPIFLSEYEVSILASSVDGLEEPIGSIIKRIVYQANDAPIFCSAYNRPVKHLHPKAATCQPFPMACNTCPMALYDE